MHVEIYGYGIAANLDEPARRGLWRRMIERARSIRTTYELDEHLARDVGAPTYEVPVFRNSHQGEWR